MPITAKYVIISKSEDGTTCKTPCRSLSKVKEAIIECGMDVDKIQVVEAKTGKAFRPVMQFSLVEVK